MITIETTNHYTSEEFRLLNEAVSNSVYKSIGAYAEAAVREKLGLQPVSDDADESKVEEEA